MSANRLKSRYKFLRQDPPAAIEKLQAPDVMAVAALVDDKDWTANIATSFRSHRMHVQITAQ